MRLRPKALIRRPLIVTAVAAALALPALAFVGPAQALDPAGVGPPDQRQFGFPTYYTDNVGTALQMCDDGSGNCLGANNASLTPGDGENFYWMATSTLTAPGIDLSVEYALEAAWLTPTTPITFDRVRIRGDVDQAGDYTLTTPFGTTHTITAEDPANQRNLNFTDDIGCGGAPCDFAAAAGTAHITDFLVNTTRPAGYLGNAATEGPATVGVGGPVATNTVTGPSGTATSANFAVMGKLASPAGGVGADLGRLRQQPPGAYAHGADGQPRHAAAHAWGGNPDGQHGDQAARRVDLHRRPDRQPWRRLQGGPPLHPDPGQVGSRDLADP